MSKQLIDRKEQGRMIAQTNRGVAMVYLLSTLTNSRHMLKKCTDMPGCPIWLKSQYSLEPNLNID
jgi:hypothetical protein